MNKSRYTLQKQIEQKNSDVPFFGTEEGARNNETTYKYFPPRKVLERQTGMIKPKSVKPRQYDVIEHDFEPCFQTACSTVFHCHNKNGEKCIPLYN